MPDVTRLLDAAAGGDRAAAADLLPLVYDELRRLAAARMADEAAGHTLQPTALVHEAFVRLVGPADAARWDGRGHFFAAAAEAMRRILVESARRKKRTRHGGGLDRVPLPSDLTAAPDAVADDLLAVDGVVDLLAAHDPTAAELVKLHVFAGLTVEKAAPLLGLSARTAYRTWAYARAWMFDKLGDAPGRRRSSQNGGSAPPAGVVRANTDSRAAGFTPAVPAPVASPIRRRSRPAASRPTTRGGPSPGA